MGNAIRIRGLEIGVGRPKICVPVTAITKEKITSEIQLAWESGADMVEWRADFYEDVKTFERTIDLSNEIRHQFEDFPIIFTYRTEDGQHLIEENMYIELNKAIAKETDLDIIDVELFAGEDVVSELCEYTKEHGKKVIVSNHDFKHTPSKDKIINRLLKMQELGADIPKIAVMPENSDDVLTVLTATNKFAQTKAKRPFITIAMGKLGSISRVSGELFGSAITFGTIGKGSAPGQLEVSELREILRVLKLEI
jgi:3-dehydroquinate dehydratase-1